MRFDSKIRIYGVPCNQVFELTPFLKEHLQKGGLVKIIFNGRGTIFMADTYDKNTDSGQKSIKTTKET